MEDPELAADLFLTLVLGGPGRLADYGIAIDPAAGNGGDRLPSSGS